MIEATESSNPDPLDPVMRIDFTKGRNLVVCCDGTGNMWGNSHDTNVVKLARHCWKDDKQVVYYDPGVGTASGFPPVGARDEVIFKLNLLVGLAMGGGIYQNIASAYSFLVDNYQENDRIFLIGFSRGAFTARSVSGMVNLFGIVRPAGDVMIPTLIRLYFSDAGVEDQDERGKTRLQNAQDIRANFTDPVGHDASVYAIGVWDTVATVGGLRSQTISSDKGTLGKRFRHVRHAVSEGEYRDQYEPRLYNAENRDEPTSCELGSANWQPSMKQLFFSGVHSDVGGSYSKAGLSDISLIWMLEELSALGLRLHEDWRSNLKPCELQCTHDQAMQGFFGPWWAFTRLQRRILPPGARLHPSLQARVANPKTAPIFWKPLLKNPVFLIPLALYVGLLCVVWGLLTFAMPGVGTSGFEFARLTQLSAGESNFHVAGYAGNLGWITFLRLAASFLLAHLLCVGCVFTVGRLRNVNSTDAAYHRKLALGLWLPLLAAAILGPLNVAMDTWFVNAPSSCKAWLASGLHCVQWLIWLVLGFYFVRGWVGGKSPVCPGDPGE